MERRVACIMNSPQGDTTPPPPPIENEIPQMREEGSRHTEKMDLEWKWIHKRPKWMTKSIPNTSTTCKPVAMECPKIELQSHRINAQI